MLSWDDGSDGAGASSVMMCFGFAMGKGAGKICCGNPLKNQAPDCFNILKKSKNVIYHKPLIRLTCT